MSQRTKIKISLPTDNTQNWSVGLKRYLARILNYFKYYDYYSSERLPEEASERPPEKASGQSNEEAIELQKPNKRQKNTQIEPINPIGSYVITTVPDRTTESTLSLIPTSRPGLTPSTKKITDCYTVFLVKIDERGYYTIHIVFTLVDTTGDNLIKLQKLIAVRVRSLVEKYNLRQIPLCLFGVIDCQLSELNYENQHKDLFNFRYLQEPLKKLIFRYIPVLTIPEYAILEFKIPDRGSKQQFTSLLTAIYPDEDNVLIKILKNATPGRRALVYNVNNVDPHSQPPNPTSLMLDENNNSLQEYNSIANKEVVKKVLRNIRRNLFKVITNEEFDRFVFALDMSKKYSLSITSIEVNDLYSTFIDCQGATCSEMLVPFRRGGKTHKKRYNAKKHTNKSKKHTKGRKTRKSRRIR